MDRGTLYARYGVAHKLYIYFVEENARLKKFLCFIDRRLRQEE